MKKLLALILLIVSAVPSSAYGLDTIELPNEPGWLPYRLVPQTVPFGSLHADEGWTNGLLIHDIDGDGFDEQITARNPGIACESEHQGGGRKQLWWFNVPADFAYRRPCASLDGIWDIAGDGTLEVVCTLHTEDRSRWLIERLRLDTGELLASYELSGGKDRWEDGNWDGHYKVIGCVDAQMPEGPRRALIVAARAGMDQQPRGVLALDIETGTVLWNYFVGPKTELHSLHVVDIDADGHQEICFSGGAVNNIHDRDYNGTRDDKPRMFVIDDNGILDWSFVYRAGTGWLRMDIADANGDGLCEFYVGSALWASDQNELLVLDHRGKVVAREEIGIGVRQLVAVPMLKGRTNVFLTLQSGEILRFEFDGAELEKAAAVRPDQSSVTIGLIDDLTPEPGSEVVFGTGAGHIWLLDENLTPLAHIRDRDYDLKSLMACTWVPRLDEQVIVVKTEYGAISTGFKLASVPRPFPVLPVSAAAVVGSGAIVYYRIRKRRRSPATIRELRLQLMSRLHLANHGEIGALVALRRLLWVHSTFAQDFRLERRPREVYAAWGREFLDTGLPNLLAATELAELAEIDGPTIQRARESAKRLQNLLSLLDRSGFSEDVIDEMINDLQRSGEETEEAFMAVRHAVESAFQADPRRIFELSINANKSFIQDNDVKVELPSASAPLCRVDSEELKFVLDNLVGNALRAMGGCQTRRLTVEWQTDDTEVVISVSDTGCGIIPDDWNRIMKPGYSSRKSGGLGLPGSQEILRKYGGSLSVKTSGPGVGTTMVVVCPVARA